MQKNSLASAGFLDIHEGDNGDVLMNPDIKFSQFVGPFVWESLPIVVMRAAPFILNLCCFFFISYFNDTNLTAAYGVSMSCCYAFALTFVFINSECMGVYVSKYMGAREYKSMRLSFFRCLGLE
jgi:Na+-driven multidrug efflux pump